MNHDPRLSHSEEHEWSVQERALAEQRAGVPPRESDAPVRPYRLMAHLLAQPLEQQLPPDFARQVARQATAETRPVDARLERSLLALLVGAMAVAGLVAIAIYGAGWLPALDQGVLGALLGKPWVWVLAACLGFSRLSRHWLHHSQPA